MPLTASCECRIGADERARLFRREGIANPDRNALQHRGRHRLRMDHLGAEVRELHGFVVGQRIDHLGIGHQARIRAQHAVDVGPDANLFRVEQRAKDRAREIAAVAAQRGLQTLRITRDEACDDQRRRRSRVRCGRRSPAMLPAHGRTKRAPFHGHDVPRIDPLTFPGRLPALRADRRRTAASTRFRRSRKSDRAPSARQNESVARPAECRRCRGNPARARQEFASRLACPAACLRSPRGACGSLRCARSSASSWRLGGRDEIQQRIGDASAGRQDHAEARMGSSSRIRATRSMHTASATLEPPNLCTRHRSTFLSSLVVRRKPVPRATPRSSPSRASRSQHGDQRTFRECADVGRATLY